MNEHFAKVLGEQATRRYGADRWRRTEIRVGGLGGQGVILCGHIIGKAASIYDNKYATLIQAFGPEARGSALQRAGHRGRRGRSATPTSSTPTSWS